MKSLRPPCESTLPITISNLTVGHEGQLVVQTTVEGRASPKVGLLVKCGFGKGVGAKARVDPTGVTFSLTSRANKKKSVSTIVSSLFDSLPQRSTLSC